ncbi:serine hydrolase domain-containing protein [Auraticoccus monumenti]|uniref:CubicO group peptidase, beta-lactamase class C family n=1 Tax=Auraticoccus monumenti TaxID=675864 RepID=A0A1G7A6F1_9ACTN|nr:serine hydrolase domain-containing protein [Auraticoccus monumenti]SDE10399.1 CubicO group peptidase, beta-lactamase class C family [Auraticoccus monumenti]
MTPLPRSTPSEQDVDPGSVLALLDAVEAAGVELHSLMVLRHGHVVAEGWWAPYTADRPHLLYSLSKSFTSTAAGLAAAEGLLDLDDTLLSHFPELDADATDPRSRSIRLRHVAAMASGHAEETLQRALAIDPVDVVRGFLRIRPDAEPGTVFAYNQPCTYSLGKVVQRHSGQRLTEYLRPRLFEPLGIGEVGWLRHGEDELGFSGLHARTEDVARLGQLYLKRGAWEGQQLLPEAWVEEATRSHVDNRTDDPTVGPDWQQGYGFQFWVSQHGFRGDGAYGQFCLVLPEQDAVVVTTAATDQMQVLLEAVWAHLLPGLGAGPSDRAAEQELLDRLAGLRLADPSTTDRPDDLGPWSRRFEATSESDRNPARVSAVTITPDEDALTLELTDRADGLRARAGLDGWLVQEADGTDGPVPVAAAAGWSDPGTLVLEVLFLETPHRLRLTCSADGSAVAEWPTVPLHQVPLAALRRPR